MNQKVKILIAGRYYPLTIPQEDEIYVRAAGEEIEKMIQRLEQNYQIEDKQDALAMSALQLATQLKKVQTIKEYNEKSLFDRLKAITELLAEDNKK